MKKILFAILMISRLAAISQTAPTSSNLKGISTPGNFGSGYIFGTEYKNTNTNGAAGILTTVGTTTGSGRSTVWGTTAYGQGYIWNSKGVILPQLTTVQRNAISTPGEGSTIFNTTTKALNYYAGLISGWQAVEAAGGSDLWESTYNVIHPAGDSSAVKIDFNNYSLMNDSLTISPILKTPFAGISVDSTAGFFLNGIGDLSLLGQSSLTAFVGYIKYGKESNLSIDSNDISLRTNTNDTTTGLKLYGNGNNVNQLFSLQSQLPGLGFSGFESQIVSGKNTAVMYATNFDGSTNLTNISVDTSRIYFEFNGKSYEFPTDTGSVGQVLTVATNAGSGSSTLGFQTLPTIPTALSGSYTPSTTDSVNITSSTPQVWYYTRVGNVVSVSGSISITTTAGAGTRTLLNFNLPVTSNISSDLSLNGVSNGSNGVAGIGTQAISAQLKGKTGASKGTLQFYASAANTYSFKVVFSYIVE